MTNTCRVSFKSDTYAVENGQGSRVGTVTLINEGDKETYIFTPFFDRLMRSFELRTIADKLDELNGEIST